MRAADDFDAIRRRMDELKAPAEKKERYTTEQSRAVALRFNCKQASCAWRISHSCEKVGSCQYGVAYERVKRHGGLHPDLKKD